MRDASKRGTSLNLTDGGYMRNRAVYALVCTCYMSVAMAAAPDRIDSQELRLPDVSAEWTRHRPAAPTLLPLTRTPAANTVSRSDPAVVSIDVDLLKAAAPSDDRPAAAARSSPAKEVQDLALTVDGQELRLRVIDTTYDP